MKSFPYKVDYYLDVYRRIHGGVIAHREFITADNASQLGGFDYAFICVDKGSARADIAGALNRLGISAIDVGIGVGREGDALDGVVRITTIEGSEDGWRAASRYLPLADRPDDDYENTQIADLNSLNAALAVVRWKRAVGFYRNNRNEVNAAYMVEGNVLAVREA